MSTAIHKVTTRQKVMTVESIWGVYHADGGLIGELKYVAGALFKGQHCSLCDITHKIAWEKSDMKKLSQSKQDSEHGLENTSFFQ